LNICDLLWQKEALGAKSWGQILGSNLENEHLLWADSAQNYLLTIDWDMDFGYNYFEKFWENLV
jgi:hypothetical protein